MSEIKLKNCPFCGSGNLIQTKLGWIECLCGCGMPAEMWNTRTPAIDKEKLVEWLLSEKLGDKQAIIGRTMVKIESGEFDL